MKTVIVDYADDEYTAHLVIRKASFGDDLDYADAIERAQQSEEEDARRYVMSVTLLPVLNCSVVAERSTIKRIEEDSASEG